jgi:hypothetical protein
VEEGNTFRNTGAKMKLKATTEKVRISWFVIAGGYKIPYNSTMAGTWGFDAKCSCGWETRTGGATRASVEAEVQSHKHADHGYTWKVGA